MLALALLAALQGDDVAEVPRLRRDARLLNEEAHRLLERADYAKAVETHQQGRRLDERARAALDGALASILPALDEEAFDVRERASSRLLAIGPSVRPRIDALLRGELSAEVRSRLQDVAALLASVEEDADGRFRQWASSASASSEYEGERWSARQALGRPDSAAGGDQATAWASKEADGTEEWLELGYAMSVKPRRIRIHESYNPGAVVKAEARGADGAWQVIWRGGPSSREGAWLTLEVEAPATRTIRLTLDSAGVAGWNEIDAVELIGDPSF